MQIIDAAQVGQALDFPRLIDALEQGFSQDFSMPPRQVYRLAEHADSHEGFALLPAWNEELIGMKAFTYFPDNAENQLPTVFAKILLFRRADGVPLAMVDGTSVTYWRTAAVSALAARYLARPDAQHLLLLGTGRLALPLLRAHLSQHALSRISVWGRDIAKAQAVVDQFYAESGSAYPELQVQAVSELQQVTAEADIIVAATGSATPLLEGARIAPGCHVDMLGNHSPDRRECDTALITRARVCVDSRENVLREAGELLIPIAEGQFQASAISAELAQLCRGEGRRNNAEEITVFKSVGTALADLLCASLVLKTVNGAG
ncbi:MAG: ornithine cyclodeaminase family protein [Undibacterium curvum]|uniref:ornithine cyclodeaminase family protein n=1 Tax=Undibacterium curvum TaxID=2762294 RepID=UPI003BC10BB4